MRVPTIDRGPAAASPWGQRRTPDEPIRLVAVPAPIAGLVLKGTLLSLVTLGIYRFWYRTKLRRYYWSHSQLLGDGFEYTGTGKELLIGFLIALAIFVPLNLVATLVGLFAGETAGGIVSTIIAALIVPAVIQIAIYRARGYRLSRTRFRGIRFHQSGSGLGFLKTTAKWLVLTALTLGIVFPYLREAMNRYRIEHTHFGSLQASCSSSPRTLMGRWLIVWFALLGAIGMLVAIVVSENLGAEGGVLALEFLAFGLVVATLPILWQIYRVHEFRHFVSTTRFGEVSLSSDAKARSVIWIMTKFLLMIGLAFGFLFFVLGGATALWALLDETGEAATTFSALGASVFVLPIALVLVYALVAEIYLRWRLWQHFLSSIALTNTDQLAQIIQSEGREGGAYGDSFDTGFDFAG